MRTTIKLFSLCVLLLPTMAQAAGTDNEASGCNAVFDKPLFDAHMHYNKPAWAEYPPSTVLKLMDDSGVAMALVSSTPDAGTISLFETAPGRIVPELRPYNDDFSRSNWISSPSMMDYLQQRMQRYPHRGIGEFLIHAPDLSQKPFLSKLAALAVQHDAIVHIHSGADAVEFFYDLQPQLTVLWAHAGMSEPPAVIGPLLARYESLYVDTTHREHDIIAEQGISPEWRRLLLQFPHRFMVGSDTWTNDQWAGYEQLMAVNRRWLACLPTAVAELIAFKNAEKLFGIRVHEKLLRSR